MRVKRVVLAKALQRRGWNTIDLGRQTGLSQQLCWRAVAGVGRPTPRNQLLIATALAYPVDELFPINDETPVA